MRLNFTLFGSEFTYGWLPEDAQLVGAAAFLEEARRRGFHGAELPNRMLDDLDAQGIEQVRRTAERYGMGLVVSMFGTEPDLLRRQICHAGAIGAKVVRTVVGGAAYGGDRRAFAGGRWQPFLATVRDRFAAVLPDAERAGVDLAVEDHQDVGSEDLLWLCGQLDSAHFGVVLDTANPLSVAEHPVDFALAVMPYIKYVHLKDYVIFWSAEGYRLVRCPVGSGAAPLREMLALLEQHGRGGSGSLERAALEARHVRCLTDDFWPEYPARSAAQFAKVMAFVRAHARPEDADYRTPFEKGADAVTVMAYEEAELQESIRLTAAMTGDYGPLEALEGGSRPASVAKHDR